VVANGTFTNLTVFQASVLTIADIVIETTPVLATWTDFLRVYGLNESDTTAYPFLATQAVYRLDRRVNSNGALGASALSVAAGGRVE
jgi:hypothetical protein